MGRYRYVVTDEAFVGLLALEDRQIAQLIPAFESLAEEPIPTPDEYSLDRSGRPLAYKFFGNILISYWPDHPTRTLHIIGVDLRRPR